MADRLSRARALSPMIAPGDTVEVVAHSPTPEERDERHSLPLDPEEALRALLKVDPDSEPSEQDFDEDAPNT